MISSFDNITLRNLSDIISGILTHKQITEHLLGSGITESSEGKNKTDRIYYSLKKRQDQDNCGNNVLAFTVRLINPKRYNDESEFETDRTRLNEKLIYEVLKLTSQVNQDKSIKQRPFRKQKKDQLKLKKRFME